MPETTSASSGWSLGGGRWLLVLALAAGALVAALALARHSPPAPHVTLTAGFGHATRDVIAAALARELTAAGLETELVPTAATASELERVDSGAIDFALVSGAFRMRHYAHVREVAPLHLEALHLLVKQELADRVGASLAGLRGRSVDLGAEGSATSGLATALLSFAELFSAAGEPEFAALHLDPPALEALLERGDREALPDALFHLGSLPSLQVLHVVRSANYRLVAVPFARAFRLGGLLEADGVRPADESLIHRSHTTEVVIPAFSYQTDPPVPAEAIPTLGAALVLVAHESVDPETVERALDVVYGSRFAHLTDPVLERSALAAAPRMRRHAGAQRFLARDQPFLNANQVSDLSNQLSILGALVGGSVFVWQAWRQRRQTRRDRTFAAHRLLVASIERRLVDLELSAELELEPLIELQRRLLELKSEALELFAAGQLGDQRVLSDLTAPIDAARSQVANLLLHVRENLEQQAESEGRSLAAVWDEATEPSDRS